MIECEKCHGDGLVLIKGQDRVCKNCFGVGKIMLKTSEPEPEPEPVIEPEVSEPEPVIESKPEKKKKTFISRFK